ncbi:hypothetical protein [Marixanthomonas ophiurae]|uniref:Uncharacterized protein n=1 Tax=Marixanthomonas ophiurae TaxID=387659 RepID=A0A3E1QAW0_9FLAO|nr:hypothetical protein [Marixanthomonas ophiurae]RFN59256.1 hypothetical protein DZ858_04070 [Marixanthomonas ophiurae]
MKALLYLSSLFLLLCAGCNKDESNDSGGIPADYFLYFDISKVDGSFFENGSVELSDEMKMENGEIVPTGEIIHWVPMGKVEYLDDIDKTLTGTQCAGQSCLGDYIGFIFSMSPENIEYEEEDAYDINRYYLLRYQGDDTDTLRIRERFYTNPPSTDFTFFLNGQEKEILGEPTNFSLFSANYITIEK